MGAETSTQIDLDDTPRISEGTFVYADFDPRQTEKPMGYTKDLM